MDVKTIAVSVVSIAIACLFAVTLLIPVIADSTAETDTFKNEGYFMVDVYDVSSADTMTISWDHTAPQQITVNDVVVDLSSLPKSTHYTIVATSETTLVRFYDTGTVQYFICYGGSNWLANTTNGYDVTIEITGSTAVFSSTQNPDNPQSVSLTGNVYYAYNSGDYTMKKSDVPAYLNGDSDIYGIGNTNISGNQNRVTKITGNIDDGFVGEVVVPNTGFTSGSVTASYTQNERYTDLYELSSLSWVVTDSNSVETTVTYSYFIVPNEVISERSIHPDANTNALLNLIPLLVIVGIILGTVGFIVLRK